MFRERGEEEGIFPERHSSLDGSNCGGCRWNWKRNREYSHKEHRSSNLFLYSLQKFFEPFKIDTIYETSLGGNQWYQDMRRLQWTTDPDFLSHYNTSLESAVDRSFVDVFNITLAPMMIRTFVISVSYTAWWSPMMIRTFIIPVSYTAWW